MSKHVRKGYDEKIIEALEKLKSPIIDRKHDIQIFIENSRARSNEGRFEHVAGRRHFLTVQDIEYIPEGILKHSIYRKD